MNYPTTLVFTFALAGLIVFLTARTRGQRGHGAINYVMMAPSAILGLTPMLLSQHDPIVWAIFFGVTVYGLVWTYCASCPPFLPAEVARRPGERQPPSSISNPQLEPPSQVAPARPRPVRG